MKSKIAIILILLFCSILNYVHASGPGIFMMASNKVSIPTPGTVTFNTYTSVPAQLTASWSAPSPSASTYNLYYALNSAASIIPANKDCTYLLLTSYDVGLDTYPTCTSGSAGSCTATAGKVTGISATSYNINNDPLLTAGSVYCSRITGVNSLGVEGLGSTMKTAAAAVVPDYFGIDSEGWTPSIELGGDSPDPSSLVIPASAGSPGATVGTASTPGTGGSHGSTQKAAYARGYYSLYRDDGNYYTDGLRLVKTADIGSGKASFWYKVPHDGLVYLVFAGLGGPDLSGLIYDNTWRWASVDVSGYSGAGRTVQISVFGDVSGRDSSYSGTYVEVWIDDITLP
jgi:hypothetical protein